jgi:hypothetical protein
MIFGKFKDAGTGYGKIPLGIFGQDQTMGKKQNKIEEK